VPEDTLEPDQTPESEKGPEVEPTPEAQDEVASDELEMVLSVGTKCV